MRKKMYGIIGVGHCCQDSICTVENYPPEDGSTHILSIDDTQGGGAVATAMAAAAKLGVKTAVIANLGAPSFPSATIFRRSTLRRRSVRRFPKAKSCIWTARTTQTLWRLRRLPVRLAQPYHWMDAPARRTTR